MNQYVHCRGLNYSLFNYDWTISLKYFTDLLYHILLFRSWFRLNQRFLSNISLLCNCWLFVYPIITYFKLIVKLRQFLSSKILYINTGDVLKRGKYE